MLAALYVYYRDLNQIWDVLLQLGFFLSPICYPLSTIPTKYLSIYLLNPVTVLMEMYRNFLIYGIAPKPLSVIYLVVVATILMVVGMAVFKRLERRFAEEI
jgi:lipopolysaccharide transport system permease protein